ncbi:MAG: MFS transporter [Candidatus Micrarchaeia archaeon]
MTDKKELANIIGARSLLSFSYGFLNILLSLYLHSIGYSTLLIGAVLGGAIFISALLTFFIAMLADHYGRKFMLVTLFLFFSIASGLFMIVRNPIILAVLAGVGSFTGSGGGPIGSGGPFGAVQTALVTEFTDREKFSRILGTASAIGMLASVGGAYMIAILRAAKVDVYLLFYLASVLGIIAMFLTLFLKDNKSRSSTLLPKLSWKNIIKLSIPAIPSGVAGGLIAPIFSLWFHLRFGIGAGEIGLIFGTANLFTVLALLILPHYIKKEDEMKAIIGSRLAAAFALMALALSPYLIMAALFLVVRNMLQMGAVPIRQAFSMGIVHESERATTSGATSFARTSVSAISPPISGAILASSIESIPLLSGAIGLLDPLLYYFLFARRGKGSSSKSVPKSD